MKKTMLIFLILQLYYCNPGMLGFRSVNFHFSSITDKGLSDIKMVIKGEKEVSWDESEYVEFEIDSTFFFTCPVDTPECNDKIYYSEVPMYTQTVPITDNFSFRRDIPCILELNIKGTGGKFNVVGEIELQRKSGINDYMIYIASGFDSTETKLSNFIKVCSRSWQQDRRIIVHSFPFDNGKDSLYVVRLWWK